ncbi:acyltransferase family protein [Pedobacter immunditicola]|uniref:acyltransferase family protein n=1 Tax=Pedobacter immunditicola TaxID=3133440 RepID=UPI00309C3F4A
MKTKSRVLELDVIRAIAVLMVIVFHYTARFDELYGPFEHNITWFKHGGVHLFFIFSGYLIYSSLLSSKNGLEFITKRILRLYPSYWVCLITSFIIISIFGLPHREVSFFDFIVNFTMVQYVFDVDSVDGVYWSLFYQLTFYFFMAFSFRIVKSKYQHLYFIAWLFLFILNSTVMPDGKINILFSLHYSMLFLGGIYFSKLYKEKSLINILMPLVTFFCFVIFVDEPLDATQIAIIGVSYLLIYAYAFQRLNLKFLAPVALLAPISFEWYLLHQNIGYIMLNLLYKNVLEHPVMILIPMTVTAAMAWVIYNYVGQPTAQYLIEKLNRYTGRHSPVIPGSVPGSIPNEIPERVRDDEKIPG